MGFVSGCKKKSDKVQCDVNRRALYEMGKKKSQLGSIYAWIYKVCINSSEILKSKAKKINPKQKKQPKTLG